MCQNNIDNVQCNGEFETKFGFIFRCSECIVEYMNIELPYIGTLFDSKSESYNDVSDIKDKSNPNDDDSNVCIFNENGEEVEEKLHNNNDIIISDNNKDEKEDIIFEKCNVTQKCLY